jgi:hypothetical protein
VQENSGIAFVFDRRDRQIHVNSYRSISATLGLCLREITRKWTSP